MKFKILLLSALFIFLGMNFSNAQGCEDDVAPGATTSGIPKKSTLTVFGYIQPEFDAHFTDPSENTFKFKRARFGVRGRVNKSWSYYFLMETSDFIASDGNIYLMDAFVSYDKHLWAKVSMGSFKQPFGREVQQACHNLTTIDRAIVSDQLVAPQRDLGVMMLGGNSQTKFKYMAALMNGRGLGVKDNNNRKDVIARMTYAPLEWLSIGGSFRYGYPNDERDRTTYGLDLELKQWNFTVSTEYIYDKGDFNRAAGGGCGSTPLELGEEREGAYVMISYDINGAHQWEPVFKYEYFDQDLSITKIGYQEMMTLGLNYFVNKSTRIQVNYQNKIETSTTIDNDALLVQLQLKF